MRKWWKTMKKQWKQWENDEKLWKTEWKQWENDEKDCKNNEKIMKRSGSRTSTQQRLARGLRPNNWLEDFDPSTRGTTTGHYNGVLQRGT